MTFLSSVNHSMLLPPNTLVHLSSLCTAGGVAHGIKAVDELAHRQYPAAAKDAALAITHFL